MPAELWQASASKDGGGVQHKEKPRAQGPGSFVVLPKGSEAVVQAAAHDVRLPFDVLPDEAGVAGHRAEVGIEIFGLQRPAAKEGIFDAHARRPTELVGAF